MGIPALPTIDPATLAGAPAYLVRSASAGAIGGGPAKVVPNVSAAASSSGGIRHLLRPAPPPPPLHKTNSSTAAASEALRHRLAWTEEDSGPIPSDIEVVTGSAAAAAVPPATSKQIPPGHHHKYPLSDYRPTVFERDIANVPNSRRPFYPSTVPEEESSSTGPRVLMPSGGVNHAQWSRSFHNPIGTVYHSPALDDSGGLFAASSEATAAAGGGELLPPSWMRDKSGTNLSASNRYIDSSVHYPYGKCTKVCKSVLSTHFRPISADIGRLLSLEESQVLQQATATGEEYSGQYNSHGNTSQNFKRGNQQAVVDLA